MKRIGKIVMTVVAMCAAVTLMILASPVEEMPEICREYNGSVVCYRP